MNQTFRPAPKPKATPKRTRRQKRGDVNKEHMARVARLPCVICWEFGMAQTDETKVHHCISGRYSQDKAPDIATIPLCQSHHQGGNDPYKIAIHRQLETWEARYGPDTDWIPWVHRALETGEFE